MLSNETSLWRIIIILRNILNSSCWGALAAYPPPLSFKEKVFLFKSQIFIFAVFLDVKLFNYRIWSITDFYTECFVLFVTAWKVSAFGVFLVGIFPDSDQKNSYYIQFNLVEFLISSLTSIKICKNSRDISQHLPWLVITTLSSVTSNCPKFPCVHVPFKYTY